MPNLAIRVDAVIALIGSRVSSLSKWVTHGALSPKSPQKSANAPR